MMADVAGYSRMMGENEEGTVEVLRGHREIFDALLKSHRGRIFNTAGDSVLAEFPSAVDAVRCATEIQTALRTRNEHLAPEQRMWFRIGINLGDVIVQGGDLLGDGVNVAARIQAIAEPGGICISGSVYDQIQNKLSLQFKQLGEKSFKNISQPVRTFSISDMEGGGRPVRAGGRFWGRALIAGGAAIVAAGVLIGGYAMYRDQESRAAEETRLAAESQKKAEQDRVATVAQCEAKLQAELQAAKDALQQAETSKRKAEQERVAAEAAQREARLQAELRGAKDALQKAEAMEKKADQERKAATAAVRSAETAMQKTAEPEPKTEAKPVAQAAPPKLAAAPATQPTEPKGVDRFNGEYAGRMCSFNPDNTPRCWPVGLTVQHGAISATWNTGRSSNPARASGTVAPDGTVNLALDGFRMDGRPLPGRMKGNWANNTITASGAWQNSVGVNGNWTRTP